MKDVIRKTFPTRVKKPKAYTLRRKKVLARQEQLKREVQNMIKEGSKS